MADKALKAVEVFFDTFGNGESAVMGFKMAVPISRFIEPGDKVVAFYFDKKQLDWLIIQMSQYVQRERSTENLWLPGMPIHMVAR